MFSLFSSSTYSLNSLHKKSELPTPVVEKKKGNSLESKKMVYFFSHLKSWLQHRFSHGGTHDTIHMTRADLRTEDRDTEDVYVVNPHAMQFLRCLNRFQRLHSSENEAVSTAACLEQIRNRNRNQSGYDTCTSSTESCREMPPSYDDITSEQAVLENILENLNQFLEGILITGDEGEINRQQSGCVTNGMQSGSSVLETRNDIDSSVLEVGECVASPVSDESSPMEEAGNEIDNPSITVTDTRVNASALPLNIPVNEPRRAVLTEIHQNGQVRPRLPRLKNIGPPPAYADIVNAGSEETHPSPSAVNDNFLLSRNVSHEEESLEINTTENTSNSNNGLLKNLSILGEREVNRWIAQKHAGKNTDNDYLDSSYAEFISASDVLY